MCEFLNLDSYELSSCWSPGFKDTVVLIREKELQIHRCIFIMLIFLINSRWN